VNVEVRRAGPADSAVLAEVAAATFGLACPPHITEQAIATFIADVLSVECFDRYLADPQRDLFVSVEVSVDGDTTTGDTTTGGTTTGYAMVVGGEPADPDVQAALTVRPTAELSKIYVLPDHHGAGTSRLLMEAAVDAARARCRAAVS
jgi:GNAT superfamily N-acetyltransferase